MLLIPIVIVPDRRGSVLLGFWPARGLLSAHTQQPMSRRRRLLMQLASLILLGLVPFLGVAILQPESVWPLLFASIQIGFAFGDVLGARLISQQCPPGSLVKNVGYFTYWRMPSASAIHPGAVREA